MKITMEQFHALLGEALMYCQLIEENVKKIYSHMKPGDYESNRAMVEEKKWTLGETIHHLEALDERKKVPFLSRKDYGLLFQVAKTRNEYAHNIYTRFCYEVDDFDGAFDKAVASLKEDIVWLSELYEKVEDTRIEYEGR